MTIAIEQTPEPPRRSAAIRSELSTARDDLSDAAKRGDRDDYGTALQRIQNLSRELTVAETYEAEAAAKSSAVADFMAKNGGHATVGELLAARRESGQQAAERAALQANRRALIAEIFYGHEKTAEELGAAVLADAHERAQRATEAAENYGRDAA